MSFGIPTDIPNIPGLSDVTTTTQSGFSQSSINAITDLTTQSRDVLFQNPMVDVITQVGGTADTLQDKLTLIASGSVLNNVISSSDASAFLSQGGIADLQTALSSFTQHTDRLSGVLQGSGINLPGLEQITTIGQQMNNMVNLIDGAQGCLSIIGCSTGIFSQDQISSVASSISSVINGIDQELVAITDITFAILNAKNTIQAIIDKDTNFLGQCVEQLKTAAFGLALSTAMNDPCAKFILEHTGTPKLLTNLQVPPTPSL